MVPGARRTFYRVIGMLTSAHFKDFLPVTVDIDCWGQSHRVEWNEGMVSAHDHPSDEAEETLAALAGLLPPCLDQVRAYRRFLQVPDHFRYIGTDPAQMSFAPADHPLRILQPSLRRRAATVVIHILRHEKGDDDRDLRLWLYDVTNPIAQRVFRETLRLDRYERLQGVDVGLHTKQQWDYKGRWARTARSLHFGVSLMWLADIWGRNAETVGDLILVSIDEVLDGGRRIAGEAVEWNDRVPFPRPQNLSVVIGAQDSRTWVLEESVPLP
jgi:hypothetical protein